ncbi:unnamed protein product, partial [Brassica napus]
FARYAPGRVIKSGNHLILFETHLRKEHKEVFGGGAFGIHDSNDIGIHERSPFTISAREHCNCKLKTTQNCTEMI